ncbi:MAG: hypothetical protein PHS34_08255 [Candidatus Omnitrophica bacterium]|nr:hypothetical protein [Candidatus Omnitrophota bacterium]
METEITAKNLECCGNCKWFYLHGKKEHIAKEEEHQGHGALPGNLTD